MANLGHSTIVVRVGEPGGDGMNTFQGFTVHEALIRQESPFFEADLSRDWKEAKEKLVPMPEDMPDTFRLYFHWIYSHRIFLDPLPDQEPRTLADRQNLLIRAYILGDKLLDPDFQDAIIDISIDDALQSFRYPMSLTRFIFNNTSPASPLRNLIVDMHVYLSFTYCFEDVYRNKIFNEETLFQIAKKLWHHRGKPMAREEAPFNGTDLCVYHHHRAQATRCYKEKYGL